MVERRTPNPELITSRGPRSISGRIQAATAGLDMRPSYDHYMGYPAILNATDKLSPQLAEAIKKRVRPDGYIVGIGTGGTFAMLEFFPEDSPPKGIIMADINPYVVAAGRVLVDALRSVQTSSDMEAFFRMGTVRYLATMEKVVARDRVLKGAMKDKFHGSKYNFPQFRGIDSGSDINVPQLIIRNFKLLRDLARGGRMVSVYSDFFNVDLVEAVMVLPEFSDSTNVIYLTNAISIALSNSKFVIGDEGNSSENAQIFASAVGLYANAKKDPVYVSNSAGSDDLAFSRTFDDLIRLQELSW